MSAATVSRIGELDAAGGQSPTMTQATALFLKVFSGEILQAFKEVNVAMERSMVRSITSGKSAQLVLA